MSAYYSSTSNGWLSPLGLGDVETRDIVPYSLRHYMITQRIMSGVDFRAIADMCGTSIT